MIVRNLATVVYTSLVDLNIFLRRDFDNNIDRMTAKRLGQWATRLYIVFLTTGVAIIALYALIQPQTLTKTFYKPSFKFYNDLLQNYGDKLTCLCSSIASTYNQFVDIQPIFHEVCSSPFSSDEWRVNLTSSLVPDLSVYQQRDYRRFLSAHLQFLNGLCQFANQSVNNSVNQFLTSFFVTTQLLSDVHFHKRISSLIEQSKTNAPTTFVTLFTLIQSINDGNAIISTYGTNFEYIVPWSQLDEPFYAPTQPIIYDNECSCGLYPNCTTEASFIERNSSRIISIKGLKMGCTPSETFRLSTLECFYDVSCINLIQNYTNYTIHTTPLSRTTNRFSINTTIDELINNIFVEKWSTSINYSSYYKQCSPMLCSYTYIQQISPLYAFTLILGLQGGLSIVLKWICPKIVEIIFKIYQYRKKRSNIIHPMIISQQVTLVEPVNTTVRNPTCAFDTMSTNVISQTNVPTLVRCSFKAILTSISLMFLVMALILFSIYITRHDKNEVILTVLSTITTTSLITSITRTTTTMAISTANRSICQLKFQPIRIYAKYNPVRPRATVVGDFNGDNILDLAFYSSRTITMNVLLGIGDGTFEARIAFLLDNDLLETSIAVADFNHDNQLDLAFTDFAAKCMTIMLGSGDGTLQAPATYSTGSNRAPTEIAVGDFDNDSNIDIVVVDYDNNNLDVFLGYGNGSFSTQTTLYTGRNSYPMTIALADFNKDNYLDIAVTNSLTLNIGVFLGYGNGSFQPQKTSFTGGGFLLPFYIAVGDFNGDTLLDVVFSYRTNSVGIMFGYGNGTFSARVKFIIKSDRAACPVAVSDFNGDGYLDVAVGQYFPYSVSALVGYGNGNFEVQTIFSTESRGSTTWVTVGDFNGDGYKDIVATDDFSGSLDILLNMNEC